MAHFAEIDENNVVIQVLAVNNEDCCDENGVEREEIGIEYLKIHHGQDKRWVQTSRNCNMRCRYAGIGYVFNPDLDAFIVPKPYSSWTLDATVKDWIAPVPQPELTLEQIQAGFYYDWNEDALEWTLITPPEPPEV